MGSRLLGGSLAHVDVASRAPPACYLLADLDHVGHVGHGLQRLDVGVDHDVPDAGNCVAQHPADAVAPTAADTYHLDPGGGPFPGGVHKRLTYCEVLLDGDSLDP